MSKKQVDKITLQTLIAKKLNIIDNKKTSTKELYVKSLDGTITIQKPDKSLCLEATEIEDGDTYLVYNVVVEPNLKDAELQKAFECVTPMEIVDKLFDPGEVTAIAKEALIMAGYGDSVKVVDEVKKQ